MLRFFLVAFVADILQWKLKSGAMGTRGASDANDLIDVGDDEDEVQAYVQAAMAQLRQRDERGPAANFHA